VSEPYTTDFEAVHADERSWLRRRRAAAGLPPPSDDVVGLAFSGGGIRSAVFNLGVLQALEKAGLMRHVDYLSTVSGGGYIGSCYSWLRAAASPAKDAPAAGSVFDRPLDGHGGNVLDWLRSHGKYLTAHRGFSIWTLLASIFASTFVNLLVIGPALAFCVWALTMEWLPIQWPYWLRLPGTMVPHAHDGFLLLLLGAAACAALLPLVAVVFALLAGVPHAATVNRINALRVFMGWLLIAGIGLLAVGLIPVVAMLSDMAQHYFTTSYGDDIGEHFPWLTPLATGLGSMLADKWRGGEGRGRLATIGVALVVYALLVGMYMAVTDERIVGSAWLLLVAALSAVLAFVCNINRVSIHAYYRARLSEAFMPPVVGAACAHGGDFGLAKVSPDTGAPLQLVNTTMNTSNSEDERDAARLGASFFFSPLYTGSQQTGFRRIDDYAGGGVALSTALTISGAAIDPDTYATDARPIAFLMGLLNVRLGFWAKNPSCGHRRNAFLPWWWIFLFREMLGIGLDAKRRHVHLSDGGGFENLGIYELVRRRTRHIVVCDAGSDPDFTLSDLGRAIERVRVDFDAHIDICADAIYHERSKQLAQQPWVMGTIRYADNSRGDILYIKPMLCAGLTADIYAYWRANPAFPDEPTSEQFFAEPQFEAYRCLGEQIVGKLLGSRPPESMPLWFEQLRIARGAVVPT
jgi:predicted acylesterase/phospholipase RssA